MKKKMKAIKNQIGCGGMSSTYTFSITAQDSVHGNAPMTEQEMKDYLWAIIESQSILAVLNIVRDY